MSISISVAHGDALAQKVDVLALKFAQRFYGVDRAVAAMLAAAGVPLEPLPQVWEFRLVNGVPSIAAKRILFVGVPPLGSFLYQEIRQFARKVLVSLAGAAPDVRHVAITIHGTNYGLDEIEAFESEVAGLHDAVRNGDIPRSLRQITIVERSRGLATRLAEHLKLLCPNGLLSSIGAGPETPDMAAVAERLQAAGYASRGKDRIFVAMPFKKEMEDTFHYGIQGAVRAAGFLCERADLSSFTGDIMEFVRKRIKSATLVIADLTDANPNVFLEVGFAWGCGVPTVLLSHGAEHLKFDVQGQRCLVYDGIKDLEGKLTQELKALKEHLAG